MAARNNSRLLPDGRVMVHRASGKVIGPVSPIYEEDWPYQNIPPTETLWRYLDAFKLEDLLKTSELHFSRPDKFTDPFEGRFSPGNSVAMSRSEDAFSRLYKLPHNAQVAREYHDTHRQVVFILCFHRNTCEDIAMWRAYTRSPESVVVTTSGKAIYMYLPQGYLKSAVRYHPQEMPRTEFDHSSLFFYKTSDYSFEREFRVLRNPEAGESFCPTDPNDESRRVPIRLKKIIHRVVTHPRATKAFKCRVDQLLREHLPSIQREDSALEL